MSKLIKAVLIDLSGTLHIDDAAIPGAINALKRLRNSTLQLKFVTNTTKESRDTLHQRLNRIGFEIRREEIFSSLSAARNLLENRNLRPLYLLSDDAKLDFDGIATSDPNAVLVGLAPEKFDYEHMTEAFRLLLDGASLIAVHKARYYKRSDGLALGPGAFVTALEYSTGVTAEVVGKPEKSFFLSALSDLKCSPEEAIMIGDDVRDDVCGAIICGFNGILVKTGKYRQGDETANPRPSHVVENFPEAVEIILNKLHFSLPTSN